ncbi:MAG: alkaline phosphatase family protein [Methylobacter sp.]
MKIETTQSIAQRFKLKPAGLALMYLASSGMAFAAHEAETDHETATPIQHVIVLIGENRTFDNVFGTYIPRKGQLIANLLTKGIVNADGTPGPKASLAAQSTLKKIPDRFFVSQPASNKVPYATLPAPTTRCAPAGGNNQPIGTVSTTQPYLEYPPQGCYEEDRRVANSSSLPNTVFPLVGTRLPYDSYTGDTVHRFYHMWEQSDCDIQNATTENPSGCLNDLYPYVAAARNNGSGGNAMGFYNVQNGDAPVLKRLADEYTLSDNFHQSVMGGTFVQHMMLGTGDAMPWQAYTDKAGHTITQPPASKIVDPTPKNASTISFTADKAWTSCDAPWAQVINDYEASLPWKPNQSPTQCEPGRYYQINNVRPGYLPNGVIDEAAVSSGAKTPPSSVRTIGDALNEKRISWAYYGGGYDAAVRAANGSADLIDLLIATGDGYCDICNPFQYAKSIMGDATQRKAHLKDATNFFEDLKNDTLPAVSYLKPDSFTDGHPASSKLNQFEALVVRVHEALKDNPELFDQTVLFVTWDEGGGYWDSGFHQPLDFFGDGPRIPMIVVSPHARGGRVDHTYGDHASILKFIERNWGLPPLTNRSRDNLPNPVQTAANPYVPTNMPAVGDLFGLLHFAQDLK